MRFTTDPAVYFDTGGAAVALDTQGNNTDASVFLFLELAGYANANRFGIYGFTRTATGVSLGNRLEVFNGAASPGASQTLEFDLASGTVTNVGTGARAVIGSTFGFYIRTPDQNGNGTREFFYTHSELNQDRVDHAWLFDTSNNAVPELLGSDVVLAFEDLRGGGDFDYNDMVVGISGVSSLAAPEPTSLLLMGTGLALAARMRRRRRA